ncbi:DNA primase [Paenibacillus mucilaginosus]
MPKLSQSTLDMIENIHTYDVVTRLGHWSKRSGQSIQVRCPNHYEKTPDTYIKSSSGVFTCFGGRGCGAQGRALQYYACLFGAPGIRKCISWMPYMAYVS